MDKVAMIKSAEVRGVLACLVDNGLVKVANEESFEAIADAVASNLGDDYTLEDVLDNTADVVETAEAIDNMTVVERAALAAAIDNMTDEERAALAAAIDEDAAAAAATPEAEKTAEYKNLMEQYGELVMAKEAGEITDSYFEKQALSIQSLLQSGANAARNAYTNDFSGVSNVMGKAKDIGRGMARGLTGTTYREANAILKDLNANLANIRRQNMKDPGVRNKLRALLGSQKTVVPFVADAKKQGLKEIAKAYGILGTGAAGTAGAAYGINRLRNGNAQE